MFYTPLLGGTYDPPTVGMSFDVEVDGPVPTEDNDTVVVVDPIHVHLGESQCTIFYNQVHPLEDDGNYGITLYLHARRLIELF